MDTYSGQFRTAQNKQIPIDMRSLQLKLSFHNLTQDAAIQLAGDLLQWQDALLSSEVFVKQRTVNARSASSKRMLQDITASLDAGKGATAGITAWVKSESIHNIRTANAYMRYIQYEWIPSHDDIPLAVDFLDTWNAVFLNKRPDSETIKHNVWNLFQLENKKFTGWCTGCDSSTMLIIMPYKARQQEYFGSYDFSICNYCLGEETVLLSMILKDFAEHISNCYKNVNIRVMLQPALVSDGPYRRYFSRMQTIDDGHLKYGCQPSEWYDYYYLQGVEWCNIISPLSQELLPSSEIQQTNHNLDIHPLPGGGRMVCSCKSILEYDVNDALQIKKMLLPALFPGWGSISLNFLFPKPGTTLQSLNFYVFPRNKWEIVPVFEDEIEIVGNHMKSCMTNLRN